MSYLSVPDLGTLFHKLPAIFLSIHAPHILKLDPVLVPAASGVLEVCLDQLESVVALWHQFELSLQRCILYVQWIRRQFLGLHGRYLSKHLLESRHTYYKWACEMGIMAAVHKRG